MTIINVCEVEGRDRKQRETCESSQIWPSYGFWLSVADAPTTRGVQPATFESLPI